MATYKYRAGFRPALKDPQIVGDKLQELRDRNVWREIKAYLFGGATIIPL